MALKAGRVGVAPDQVDDFGKVKSDATSGYTKQEADAKFQPLRLEVPVRYLNGSVLDTFKTVEDALSGSYGPEGAMTNRELTEIQKGVDGEITFESAISQASVGYAKLVKFGRIVYCQLKLNAISVNAWTKMGTIPSGFRPLYELFLPMWVGSNIDHIRIQKNGEIGSGEASMSNANVRFSGFWITS